MVSIGRGSKFKLFILFYGTHYQKNKKNKSELAKQKTKNEKKYMFQVTKIFLKKQP